MSVGSSSSRHGDAAAILFWLNDFCYCIVQSIKEQKVKADATVACHREEQFMTENILLLLQSCLELN